MVRMRILFIGNSHTYVNDLPQLAAQNARADGYECEVTMISHPGWYLYQHVEQPETTFNIKYGNYSYVVLQEHAHPFDNMDAYHEAAGKLCAMIKAAGSRAVLYGTWAPQKQPEVQAFMNETHRFVAEENGILFAPVGEAWHTSAVRDSYYAGDGEHASAEGSALAAKIIWNTIREAENNGKD